MKDREKEGKRGYALVLTTGKRYLEAKNLKEGSKAQIETEKDN